ncbi:MAG: hypothetical protein J6V53_06605 [Alphaproteobacteria bacterium]|nr:hypothetical protein [Alphaproteobacteria bacterium]
MKDVNRNLNHLSKKEQIYSSRSYHIGLILTEDISTTHLNKNNTDLTSPTLCFSKELIKLSLQIEQNPSLIKEYIPTENKSSFIVNEDRLLNKLARTLGHHIERESFYPSIIYGWQYRSVMRNRGYILLNKTQSN